MALSAAKLLVRLLRDPQAAAQVRDWTSVISVARAESLIGSLAHRLEETDVPAKAAAILKDARRDFAQVRVQALWEAEMARRALAPVGVPVILLKGSAYAVAGLDAGVGRSIGDLDIMVPRAALPDVEKALLEAGWEHVKEDGYDDHYYREWMHELPPLIHRERDRMIDVHHTILPLTARRCPDAEAMIADSRVLGDGLRVLAPEDMVIHSVAHLFADGDLAGGLRNLWDIDRLVRELGREAGFHERLMKRADRHQLLPHVSRALRLARRLYGTPVDAAAAAAGRMRAADALFERRLMARDGWGRGRHRASRFGFYLRSHLLRMPPLMLARHLWTKARR